jgi:hypothetical protein
MYYDENFEFDSNNQRVRCLVHIINLSAQDALKTLKGTGPNNEEEVLQNNSPVEVVAKVMLN